jgi:pyrimidine deaminase RibD-like protein
LCVSGKKNGIKACAELIFHAGIATVVYGIHDQNMHGQGSDFLKSCGINSFQYGGLNQEIENLLMP